MSTEAVAPRTEKSTANPYLFLVGCPRSGTTLLKRMIQAHSKIAIPRASYWIARWFEKRRGLTPDGHVTPELIRKLVANPKFRMGLGQRELEDLLGTGEPVSYARFVTRIFDRYAQAQGRPFVGDKTPSYVRNIRTLHELFPATRFVHLVRDGRDVCLSVANWRKAAKKPRNYSTWPEFPVSTAALWWDWHVRLGREAGRAVGPESYYEIRYESLVKRPREECEALCDFLGIAFEEHMLRFHETRTKRSTNPASKRQWLPPTPGLRDWRTQMSASDLEKFESVAGDLLEELGYERSGQPCGHEAASEASELRDAFSRDVRARGLELPERWGG